MAMRDDELKPGVRVQITGRFARQLHLRIAGEHGTIQDPPIEWEGDRRGYARVLLDRECDEGFGEEGIMLVDPVTLQPEGAPPPGQSVRLVAGPPLSPDVIPTQSAPPPAKPFSHCPAPGPMVPRRVDGCGCSFCSAPSPEERERLEDELDALEAEQRLADEGDQAIPYSEARRQLGLDDDSSD